MPKLSPAEVQRKLQEGRNYKHLYHELKHKYDDLKVENAALRLENQALKQDVATFKIQISELQTMVFGKHRKPPAGRQISGDFASEAKLPRSKDSYRRPIPPAHTVTSEVNIPLPDHCVCGGSLSNVTIHDRYEEDIPLPDLTKNYQAHLVTKYRIARGSCTDCGKTTSGRDLGGGVVALGSNVRLLICHLTSVIGMSYATASSLLLGLYGLTVSDGEIANIIQSQHQSWLPEYEKLKADIRAAPTRHYDETSWPIQSQQGSGYAWVMSDGSSVKSCFALETSRGTRHAQSLHGDSNASGVRITDDYGVYRNLSGYQQLCWVHLYRSIRDLRYNANLPKDQLVHVTRWYKQFAGIYQRLRQYLAEPYDKPKRNKQAEELWQCLQSLLSPKATEPQKLARLKAQLTRAGKDRLFICLPKDTACDNNRAERDLRQLVLKRKRSFGSKTERGAQALATVLSICTTAWRSNQTGYFKALAAVGV